MRRGAGNGASSVTVLSGSVAASARPCAEILSTTADRPVSINACNCGWVPRSASRIDGCARSTILSVSPLPSPSNTPARAKPSALKLTNFMTGPSPSRDPVAVDHGAIDLDAETGAGRNGDHTLHLMD